ncbi:MAG: hypothetical protein M1826_007717 [Phylliscum demangeonii]|nr:MAG: hypothetical protein M1826_007717 [Phylliscum demangeonii]
MDLWVDLDLDGSAATTTKKTTSVTMRSSSLTVCLSGLLLLAVGVAARAVVHAQEQAQEQLGAGRPPMTSWMRSAPRNHHHHVAVQSGAPPPTPPPPPPPQTPLYKRAAAAPDDDPDPSTPPPPPPPPEGAPPPLDPAAPPPPPPKPPSAKALHRAALKSKAARGDPVAAAQLATLLERDAENSRRYRERVKMDAALGNAAAAQKLRHQRDSGSARSLASRTERRAGLVPPPQTQTGMETAAGWSDLTEEQAVARAAARQTHLREVDAGLKRRYRARRKVKEEQQQQQQQQQEDVEKRPGQRQPPTNQDPGPDLNPNQHPNQNQFRLEALPGWLTRQGARWIATGSRGVAQMRKTAARTAAAVRGGFAPYMASSSSPSRRRLQPLQPLPPLPPPSAPVVRELEGL